MSIPELIQIKNMGRHTFVYVAGVELSQCIYGLEFDQSEKNLDNPKITANIDIRKLLEILSEITPEQLEEAKKMIAPYLTKSTSGTA